MLAVRLNSAWADSVPSRRDGSNGWTRTSDNGHIRANGDEIRGDGLDVAVRGCVVSAIGKGGALEIVCS